MECSEPASGGRALSAPAYVEVDEVLARNETASLDRCRSARGHRQNGDMATTVLRLEPGAFDPSPLTDGHEDSLGLLILDGLIVVELEAGRSRVGWLIGDEDLIRPWQLPQISIATTQSWRAVTETRIAVLDHRVRRRAATTPGLIDELLAHAADTTHWLLAQSLLLSSPSVEERLLLWFALCGERWGKVTPDGVVLELPLTHDLLGALVAAKRPTVSLALRSLAASGFLARDATGTWLLSPDSQWHATNTDHSPFPAPYVNALGLHLLSRTDEIKPVQIPAPLPTQSEPS